MDQLVCRNSTEKPQKDQSSLDLPQFKEISLSIPLEAKAAQTYNLEAEYADKKWKVFAKKYLVPNIGFINSVGVDPAKQSEVEDN
jgi:hypothetical protein